MPFLYGMEACEHKPLLRTTVLRFVLWVLPNRGKIVSKLSVGQFFGSVTQIPDTDHSSIVKPDRFNHPSHDFLVTFYLRFRAFLNEKGVTPVHAEDVRSPDATDDLALKIASIRRGLLSARNLYELRECRAQALSLMEERPNQPDLRLLLEQIEDAIAVEQEHAESAVQRKLRLSGAGVTMLALLIAALIIGPGQIHKAFTRAMNSFRGSR